MPRRCPRSTLHSEGLPKSAAGGAAQLKKLPGHPFAPAWSTRTTCPGYCGRSLRHSAACVQALLWEGAPIRSARSGIGAKLVPVLVASVPAPHFSRHVDRRSDCELPGFRKVRSRGLFARGWRPAPAQAFRPRSETWEFNVVVDGVAAASAFGTACESERGPAPFSAARLTGCAPNLVEMHMCPS